MRPNVAFTATLILDSMRTGRSAKYLVWRDADGHHYPMFISDLTTMLPLVTVRRGVVSGTWIVRKKGQNFGIALDTGRSRTIGLPADRLWSAARVQNVSFLEIHVGS
jgi:hypothetical protein